MLRPAGPARNPRRSSRTSRGQHRRHGAHGVHAATHSARIASSHCHNWFQLALFWSTNSKSLIPKVRIYQPTPLIEPQPSALRFLFLRVVNPSRLSRTNRAAIREAARNAYAYECDLDTQPSSSARHTDPWREGRLFASLLRCTRRSQAGTSSDSS